MRLGTNGWKYLLGMVLALLLIVASYYLLTRDGKEDDGDGRDDSLSPAEANEPDSEPADTPIGEDEYAEDRARMVKTQIRARDVRDLAVLAAMNTVQRHLFVPDYQIPYAYEDRPLPIGYGQTISQPYIVAVMTEALRLEAGKSKALEIGTGSGYQAAVLAQICSQVYTVEIVPELAERAADTLDHLACTNVEVRNSDGYYGWEENAPYDAIIITCAASHIPPSLIDQLAEGGRLVLPLGSPYSWQTLTVVEKQGQDTKLTYMFPVVFVPMTGEIEGGEQN